MNTAEALVACLKNEGVKRVFALPGEEIMDLMAAMIDVGLELVITRHEQGAAFMADVTGRLTGKAGVCLATLGPGAANLVTGVADADTVIANYVTNDADDTMVGDLVLDDTDVGTALTVRADSAGTGATVGLLITTDDNGLSNYDPFEIRDDSGSGNNLLFAVDHTGAITAGSIATTLLSGSVTDAQVPDNITIDTANAGDTATAFVSSGFIEHEYGGLEADVNAYNGLIRIASGATSNVTNLAGVEHGPGEH